MNVKFLEAARMDLTDAESWYEAEEVGLGSRFLAAIEAIVFRLRDYPDIGTPASGKLRIIYLSAFPYAIIYSTNAMKGVLLIVSIAHHSRKPGFWLGRLKSVTES